MSPATSVRIALAQAAVFIAALAMLLGLWNGEEHADALTWPLCAFFTAHFAWVFYSWRMLTGRWLDAYSVFFLSLSLFNGGGCLLETFGIDAGGLFTERFSVITTNQTILLVNAAVTAYHLTGVAIGLQRACHAGCRPSPQPPTANFSAHAARWIGMVFVALSAPALAFQVAAAVGQAAANGYFSLYQQASRLGVDNWQTLLGGFLLPGILILLAICHRSRRDVMICWGILLVYVAANLFIGARAAAFMACVPAVLLHHNMVGKIRPAYLVGGSLLILVLVPLVAQTRNRPISERYVLDDALLLDNPAVATFQEMGTSATTLAHTLELVPATRDFECGAGYGYALLTAVPNLFWQRHPAAERGTFANWLVWSVEPGFAREGGGLGFSVLAEAYANFSIAGPPLIGAILGLAIAALVLWARETQEPFLAALEMLVLSALLILPRSEAMGVCRPLVWFCLIPYLWVRRPGRCTENAVYPVVAAPFHEAHYPKRRTVHERCRVP